MESIKNTLGGLAGLYDHWQDILDTAEEIETFSGAAFKHVTSAEFLTQWQTGMMDSIDTAKRLDVSMLETTLQDQIAMMVAQAGGVLSKAIPDNLKLLMDNLKDYVPSDIPQRDKILAAANLIRNNVSVEIREIVPIATSSTTQSSTTQSSGTQTTSTASANDANKLLEYLLDAAFPELQRYEGNAWSLYSRLRDVMEASNIQAVLEAELQPIKTMLTSGKTSTGGPLTAEALLREIPTILRKLLTRAMTMVEDLLGLLVEGIRLVVSVVKTIHGKLTSSPSSWPDSSLKTFVQQLGLEKMPGLATLPSLLISMVLVPVYKAATGTRPSFSTSIFQADESHKSRCDKASAWLGLICWAGDTLEAGCGTFDASPVWETRSTLFARILGFARGILDIVAFHLPESDDKPDDPPETNDEKYRKALETAEAWVNFTKDVCLLAVSTAVDIWMFGYYWIKFAAVKNEADWKDEFWGDKRVNYRDSQTLYNWFNQINDSVSFALEIVALGLGGRLVALDRQDDASYDTRDHGAKMLGSSLSIVGGIIGLVDSWRDDDQNLKARSLTITGNLGVTGQNLTATITDTSGAARTSEEYCWCVNGAVKSRGISNQYTQQAGDSNITVVATYKTGDPSRVLRAAAGPESLSVTGVPKAGQTLTVKPPASVTNPQYTWYRTKPDQTVVVLAGPIPSATTYAVTIGDQNAAVVHGDAVHVKCTGDNKFYESRKLVILDTPGTLALASSGTSATQTKVGETITATLTDADGVDVNSARTYTWTAGNTKLDSITTNTYVVKLGAAKTSGEVRHNDQIKVTATYTDKGGTAKTLTSRAIKVVRKGQGAIKCTKNGGNLVIELESVDGIAQATATWTHSTSTSAADCSSPAKTDTKWTWTVAIGTLSPAPTGIKVTVKYKDLGSDAEHSLNRSVA